MSKAKKQKRGYMKKQVLNYLKRTSKKSLTYGDLAKHFDTAPMAIGQALSGLAHDGHKALTKKVVSKKAA